MLRFGFIQRPIINTSSEKFTLNLKQFVRYPSFFSKATKDELWKGVTSVSNAGRRRGRGSRIRRRSKSQPMKDVLGVGKANIQWPGLNTNILSNKTVMTIYKDKSRVAKVEEEKPVDSRFKKKQPLHPLERGWSGRGEEGQHKGPPDPVDYESYEQFDSVVVEQKLIQTMKGSLGRKREYLATVITGNGDGLIGFATARALTLRNSVRKAKNKAIKKLLVIDLENKSTVNYNFFSQFIKTKVFGFQMPEGYGLVCHRAIKNCCEVLGIKNLHAKVEGSTNVRSIIRAFLTGLIQQKTYQEIANEKKLHVVEIRKEMHGFPKVLASPDVCLTPEQARKEITNFEEYTMGNIVYRRKKRELYKNLPSWTKHLKRTLFQRNHDKVKRELLVEYGQYQSFLVDRYPECTNYRKPKAVKE